MGYKKVCIPCRKSFTREKITLEEDMRDFPCPDCGNEMVLAGHRFRPPKKESNGKWKAVEYLFENGFKFSEWSSEIIPETKREAKEFIERERLRNERAKE